MKLIFNKKLAIAWVVLISLVILVCVMFAAIDYFFGSTVRGIIAWVIVAVIILLNVFEIKK